MGLWLAGVSVIGMSQKSQFEMDWSWCRGLAGVVQDNVREIKLGGNGTILLTGGLGGLGQAVARHLVTEHGARSLLITSRRGMDTEGAAELVEALQDLGAEQVVVEACDVTQAESLRGVLGGISDDYPLMGVMHLAGVLRDGLGVDLELEDLHAVCVPR